MKHPRTHLPLKDLKNLGKIHFIADFGAFYTFGAFTFFAFGDFTALGAFTAFSFVSFIEVALGAVTMDLGDFTEASLGVLRLSSSKFLGVLRNLWDSIWPGP